MNEEVLMESLRQRETELYSLQDEVERLREGIKAYLIRSCYNLDIETKQLKEMIE